MKKLVDLRFVIGAFFLIVGLILLLYFFFNHMPLQENAVANSWCGLTFTVFGCFMIFLSYRTSEAE